MIWTSFPIWRVSSLFNLQHVHRKLNQTLATCGHHGARLCVSFLWIYGRSNKLETHQVLLSLFCLQKYQFWFLLMLTQGQNRGIICSSKVTQYGGWKLHGFWWQQDSGLAMFWHFLFFNKGLTEENPRLDISNSQLVIFHPIRDWWFLLGLCVTRPIFPSTQLHILSPIRNLRLPIGDNMSNWGYCLLVLYWSARKV